MNWTGRKKVAFIPLYRTNAAPPDQIPPDWENEIRKRVELDPSQNGTDRSIRAWVRKMSLGAADVDPVVLPMKTITGQHIEADALEQEMGPSLRAQGFDGAAIVMLGGPGAGTNAGFWSRFVMREPNGVWMMELMHGLTGLADYYHFNNDTDPLDRDIATFDEMSASALTHLTNFSKVEIGWLDPQKVALFSTRSAVYDLQYVSTNQLPPPGRWSGVRIGTDVPYIMIEARKKSDQFDSGIASEGVIIYRVQTTNPYTNVRPGGRKPLYLITTTALKPGESATIDNGIVVSVTAAIDGGFRIRVNDPTKHLFDRTAEFGLPAAASPPSASTIQGLGVEQFLYRNGANDLYEIWRNSGGDRGTRNMTADASAAKAKGTPHIFVNNQDLTSAMLFRGSDDNVRSIYYLNGDGAVGQDNLSGSAPKTASDPVGYYNRNSNVTHVIYRSANGHLHELYWEGNNAVSYGGNLTGSISAPKAVGQPSAYCGRDRDNAVVYRATNGEIMSLYWSDGPSGLDGLSNVAGTPRASGDPVAYYTPHNEGSQVVYLGTDGHLWELYWLGNNVVQGWDITAVSGAPLPAPGTTPAAYYSAGTNTKHVYYRTANNRLHELWWIPGGTNPAHVDMTERYGLPPAADRPAAFTVEGPNTQHVVYRGTDKHIYEVIWE